MKMTGKSQGTIFYCVLATVLAACTVYGVLVWDIAREYIEGKVDVSAPGEGRIVLGNLWDKAFAVLTTPELAAGISSGAVTQRAVYVSSTEAMVSHWIGGGLLMVLGPLQFLPGKRGTLHRVLGYAYYAAAMLNLCG